MTVEHNPLFKRQLTKAPLEVRAAFQKQVAFLLADLRHPSLRAKNFDEAHDIWQARVNRDWRFYFRIIGDTYRLLEIIPHPK